MLSPTWADRVAGLCLRVGLCHSTSVQHREAWPLTQRRLCICLCKQHADICCPVPTGWDQEMDEGALWLSSQSRGGVQGCSVSDARGIPRGHRCLVPLTSL